tara:strand:- start:88 stop:333 length:246 start_codon:yes stop_codon:yes gene_type:complete
MKTIIHVNQNKIRCNINKKDPEPVLTVKTYKSNDYGYQAIILDSGGDVAARVIYSPHKPLGCGARVWIETQNKVIIDDSSV